MGYADRPRDAAEGQSELGELEGMGLLFVALRGVLHSSFLRGSASEFSLRDVGTISRLPKEDGGTFATVIVRSHMTLPAKGDELVGSVVAREAERFDVMNVERAAILGRGLAAVLADSVAVANQSLGYLPPGPVIEGATALPVRVQVSALVA